MSEVTSQNSGVNGVMAKMNYHKRPEGIPSGQGGRDGRHPLDRQHDADDKEMFVTDVRSAANKYTFDNNGFEFIKHTTSLIDFQNPEEVRSKYYPEIQDLVQKQLGAKFCVSWNHETRNSKLLGTMNGPLIRPHIDRTARCVRSHFPDFFDEETCKKLEDSKVVLLSVWRPLKKVECYPIGVLDSQSYDSKDLLAFTRPAGLAGGGSSESYVTCYDDKHSWCYMSEQKPDDVLFIKFTDERGGHQPTGCPHCGFAIPGTEDKTPRESIEVRVIAAFD